MSKASVSWYSGCSLPGNDVVIGPLSHIYGLLRRTSQSSRFSPVTVFSQASVSGILQPAELPGGFKTHRAAVELADLWVCQTIGGRHSGMPFGYKYHDFSTANAG